MKKTDEEEIRGVVATWLRATAEGDLETVLGLMSEEVVFLLPGQEPMRGRAAFAEGFLSMKGRIKIEAVSEIQEILVMGDYASCWNRLRLTLSFLPGGEQKHREGPVLSLFRREEDGRWRIYRDANMLSEAKS